MLLFLEYVPEGYYWDQRNFINNEEKAEAILAECGTTVDEVYEYLKGEINGMIDEWLEINEGRSKFSKDDYGMTKVMFG